MLAILRDIRYGIGDGVRVVALVVAICLWTIAISSMAVAAKLDTASKKIRGAIRG